MKVEMKDYRGLLDTRTGDLTKVEEYAIKRFLAYSGVLETVNKGLPKTVKPFELDEVCNFIVLLELFYYTCFKRTILPDLKDSVPTSKDVKIETGNNTLIDLSPCDTEFFYSHNSGSIYKIAPTGEYITDVKGNRRKKLFLRYLTSKNSTTFLETDVVMFFPRIKPSYLITDKENKRYYEFVLEISKTPYGSLLNGHYCNVSGADGVWYYDITVRKESGEPNFQSLLLNIMI